MGICHSQNKHSSPTRQSREHRVREHDDDQSVCLNFLEQIQDLREEIERESDLMSADLVSEENMGKVNLMSAYLKGARKEATHGVGKELQRLGNCEGNNTSKLLPPTPETEIKTPRSKLSSLVPLSSSEETGYSLGKKSKLSRVDRDLFGAVRAGRNDMVDILLAKGANPNVRNALNRSPLETVLESQKTPALAVTVGMLLDYAHEVEIDWEQYPQWHNFIRNRLQFAETQLAKSLVKMGVRGRYAMGWICYNSSPRTMESSDMSSDLSSYAKSVRNTFNLPYEPSIESNADKKTQMNYMEDLIGDLSQWSSCDDISDCGSEGPDGPLSALLSVSRPSKASRRSSSKPCSL